MTTTPCLSFPICKTDLMTEGAGEEIHLEHVSRECSRNISCDVYIWVTSLHCGIKLGGRAVTMVMVNLHWLLLFSWVLMDPETRVWMQGVSLGLTLRMGVGVR